MLENELGRREVMAESWVLQEGENDHTAKRNFQGWVYRGASLQIVCMKATSEDDLTLPYT